MQPKLPLRTSGLLYECANPDCFYEGTLMDFEDVTWIEFYNHELGDMDVRSTCPSCSQPMMIWDGNYDAEKLQALR